MSADIAVRLTAAVRAADSRFESIGGSSRHYVNDCLLPALEAGRLVVVDVLVPQHLKSAERDVASLGKKLDAAELSLNEERGISTSLLTASEAVDKMARFVFGEDMLRWPAQWREELIANRAAIAKARGADRTS